MGISQGVMSCPLEAQQSFISGVAGSYSLDQPSSLGSLRDDGFYETADRSALGLFFRKRVLSNS